MAQSRGRRGEKSQQKKSESLAAYIGEDFIPLEPLDNEETSNDPFVAGEQAGLVRDNRSSFFGLLNREELEYFKNAESILSTNSLRGDERQSFIDNVFDEARDKELKIATNQVGSKLVERMVLLASESQLEQLCRAMEPFCVDLAYQKFSSHCLEAVVLRAITSMICEKVVIDICTRLSQDLRNLSNDSYGSHVLSTLLLGLSGQRATHRSKKSQLARKHTEIEAADSGEFEVSQLLRKAGIDLVTKLEAQLTAVDARKMAIDPTRSTVAQAIVVAESKLMSGYSLVDKILTDSSGFISHCLSDIVGSHFLEAVLRTLPAKRASKFIDSIGISKIAASENESTKHLVQTVIGSSNLPKKRKIELIHSELKPYLGSNIGLALEVLEIDFDNCAPLVTEALGELDLSNTHHAAVYEKLSHNDVFIDRAVNNLIKLDDSKVKEMGLDPTQSFVLQSLLTWQAPLIARRKLLNKLVPLVPYWALNAFGSHVVDSIWSACYRLKFARERVASELLKLEEKMKHSPYGRKVWNNWYMEKYLRKRHEWFAIVKQDEDRLREQEEKEKVTQDIEAKDGRNGNKLANVFRNNSKSYNDSYKKRKVY